MSPDENAPLPADLELHLVAPERDLGDGFTVRRALPQARRRMVGPFVFLDQMGPHVFTAGEGLDVRPHPHIGLSTVTYLFEGEIVHRDTLGVVQSIRPGAVNLMTAGRGVAHSERTAPEVRRAGGRVFGIQMWVALPRAHEEVEPSFVHTPADALPVVQDAGAHVRVIAGTLYGARSPVRTLAELFYAAAELEVGARLPLPPPEHEERGVYVAQGTVELGGRTFGEGELLVLRPGADAALTARTAARVLLLGGATMDGPRHMFWNFVSSSRERIEQAKSDWREGRFGQVPGETEFIPLPNEERPPVVRYP